MPYLTVNIAASGTPLQDDGTSNPGTSSVGHMFYELTDDNGNTTSYGFGPKEHGHAWGNGKVYHDDNSNYQDRAYKRTIEISQNAYDKMSSFGNYPKDYGFDTDYNGLYNSCIDFTWKALEVGGITNSSFEGLVWPTHNEWPVDMFLFLYDSGGYLKIFGEGIKYYAVDGLGDLGDQISKIALGLIDPANNEMPQWAKDLADTTYRIAYYDPLALDLNGDGIITTLAEANSAGALFDHDGDGIRTATGWVDKEDGILVRDINGNGIIDNGKELFGDNTILKNGQKATSGLQALADLDDNADGIIDAKDQAFNSLKVWQDKNGDGISTTDELHTLTELGITSINVKDKQTANEKVSGGTIKEQTTFTKADGTTSKVADINFTNDGVHSQYIEKVAVSDAVAKLPDLKGFGRLADLHQAERAEQKVA